MERPPPHRAVFHQNTTHVTRRIASFLAEGLAAGERGYVFATRERWGDISAHLEEHEPRFRAALDGGRLLWLDAADILDAVAPDGCFDRTAALHAFDQLLKGVNRCRIYGEVVTLLMRQGHVDSAAALEALGQELAHTRQISILCGYDLTAVEDLAVRARLGDLHDQAIDVDASDDGVLTEVRPLVLLVDDVEDARDMYSEYLRYSGFRVVTAVDGAEAIRLAPAYRPDIVLMDVRMPRVTGPEALRHLRADPRLAGVPILALTAHALQSEQDALLAEGFDDVIAKPCLPDQLVLTIRRVLGSGAEAPPLGDILG